MTRCVSGRPSWESCARTRPHARLGSAGFTLVELLVAAAIGLIVLGSSLMLYGLATRSRGATSAAEGLRSAMLIEESIEADLHRLVQIAGCPVRFWPDRASRLAFWMYDPADRSVEEGIRAVRYSLAGPGAMLMREYNARELSVGSCTLTTISFSPSMGPTGPLVRVSMAVARGPGDPPGAPVEHTFLARLNAGERVPDLSLTVLSGFLDPRDAPEDQQLP